MASRLGLLCVIVGWGLAGPASAEPLASGLKATPRHGQVFLTWQEAASPEGTSFNVYVSAAPIVDLRRARRIGHHIERRSARDWWQDPASFSGRGEAAPPTGYRLDDEAAPLDPQGGLFVHTVASNPRERLYFAVTHSDAAGREDTTLLPGANSLLDGVRPEPGRPRAIWQRPGRPPEPGAGRGKALWLNLHGRSTVVAGSEYLAFGDGTLGWREGLPFRFSVRVQGDDVVIRPTDRTWINRASHEGTFAGASAIWSFWYGYNSNIFDRSRMAEGVPTNYTERRLLWILDWVSRHYETDPERWYCSGSSMGGCGTISFGLRHPELFAACHAHVPMVSYTYLGRGSARSIEAASWIGTITPDVMTNEGVPLLERLDGTRFLRAARDDLPYLFVLHGRRDNSIPWENNPPFYRALEQGAQGYAVYWDNGEHSTSGADAPDDVKAWRERFRRIRRDESYPAFGRTSTNREAGDGRATDGDLVGWLNRGMDWKDIEDERDRYALTVVADYPGIAYPVTTDVRLRRLQRFQPGPGAALTVQVGEARPGTLTTGPAGEITIPNVALPNAAGVRIVLRRR